MKCVTGNIFPLRKDALMEIISDSPLYPKYPTDSWVDKEFEFLA
jgi:hypothetical protein